MAGLLSPGEAGSKSGETVLMAEQNAAPGLDISDRAYVLQRGRVVLQGLAEG
jgi:branched-chain amino acid transport system ATP-binding protein